MACGMVLAATLGLVGCSSAPPAPDGIHDRKNQAADYLKFGRQAFHEARFDQALSFYQIALDLDTAVDDDAGMAAAWNSLSTAQTALGKTDDARASLSQAEVFAALAKDQTLIQQVAVNFAQAALTSGRLTEARQRLTALQPFPETAEGATMFHTLGLLEKAEGHLPQAVDAFDRAYALNQRWAFKQEMASNRFMRASVLSQQGKWDAAVVDLQEALGLDRTMENTLGIGQDWRALGTVAQKRGDNKGAMDAWVRAARVFQAAGLVAQQKKTVELILPVTVALGLSDETARYQGILDRLNLVK